MAQFPYRQPYIEMFEQMRDNIEAGDYDIKQIEEYFEYIKELLDEDVKDCVTLFDVAPLRVATDTVREGS